MRCQAHNVRRCAMSREPTRRELALALDYIDSEFRITDRIEGDQWAEGLAWSSELHQGEPMPCYYAQADSALPQLSGTNWRYLAAWADEMRSEQLEQPRFRSCSAKLSRESA